MTGNSDSNSRGNGIGNTLCDSSSNRVAIIVAEYDGGTAVIVINGNSNTHGNGDCNDSSNINGSKRYANAKEKQQFERKQGW